jgi:hypothetical protein
MSLGSPTRYSSSSGAPQGRAGSRTRAARGFSQANLQKWRGISNRSCALWVQRVLPRAPCTREVNYDSKVSTRIFRPPHEHHKVALAPLRDRSVRPARSSIAVGSKSRSPSPTSSLSDDFGDVRQQTAESPPPLCPSSGSAGRCRLRSRPLQHSCSAGRCVHARRTHNARTASETARAHLRLLLQPNQQTVPARISCSYVRSVFSQVLSAAAVGRRARRAQLV